jgi:hypothetical protein
MLEKSKTSSNNADDVLSTMRRATRTTRGRRNGCRLTIRNSKQSPELAVLLTEAVVAEMGSAIGRLVALYFDETKLILAADDEGGEYTVRKQASANKAKTKTRMYPYILIPVGRDHAFDCKIDGLGSVPVKHEVDNKKRLILHLPERVRITTQEGK